MRGARHRWLVWLVLVFAWLAVPGVVWAAAPPEDVTEGIAFIGPQTVDLTWLPSRDYPEGTFVRAEVWRGPSSTALTQIATLTDPTAWFYRDDGLPVDATYSYRVTVVYYPPGETEETSTRTLFTKTATTGKIWGHYKGGLFRSLVVSGGRYPVYDTYVREGAALTLSPGTRLYDTGTDPYDWPALRVRGGRLEVDGVIFEDDVELAYGYDWGTMLYTGDGWVRNVDMQGGRIVVAAGGSVQIENVVNVDLDAGGATGRVDVRDAQGPWLRLSGTGTAQGVTFDTAFFSGDVLAIDAVVADELRAMDDVVLRHCTVAGTTTLDDRVRVERGSQLGSDYLGGDVEIAEGAAGVEIIDSTIGSGAILLPEGVITITGSTIHPYDGDLIDSFAFGNWTEVTLIRNEIRRNLLASGIEQLLSDRAARLTMRENVITGNVTTCGCTVLDITDNIFNGQFRIGLYPLTCNGDAVGTIARNTIQNLSGTYGYGFFKAGLGYAESHDGLVVQHNCFQNLAYGARLATSASHHGPVDLRENWWDHSSGPYHADNPGGQGLEIQTPDGQPVLFSPWDTAPTYCRAVAPEGRRVGEILLEMPAPIRPDGVSDGWIGITVLDAAGRPYADGNVGLSLTPDLGTLASASVRANAVGRATVRYVAPDLDALGDHDEVELRAEADGVVARGALQFEPPAPDATAEPRFHAFGWDAAHALLPPDPGIEARLTGRLTYQGEPVANYPVTLTLETADGVFDGRFVNAGNREGPVTDHQVVVRTDGDGALWATYRPSAQGSRPGTVRDRVRLHSANFPHIGAWMVEIGMDLELVAVRAPNLTAGNAIMGQAEPLQLFVRDALHPAFPLSSYRATDDPVLDPETDAFMGVTVDISYPTSPTELLDLLQLVHLQVPRHQRLRTYLTETGDGTGAYLRTSATTSNLPEIMPWMAATNVYWVTVHLTPVGESRFVRESFNLDAANAYDLENNTRLLGMVVDPELTSAVEIFFRDNPCNTGTQWGQEMKCGLALVNMIPALQTLSGAASTALNLCETFFNILRGQYADAAMGANGLAYGALSDYVEANKQTLLLYGELGLTGYRSLTAVGQVAGLFDCYWAVKRGVSGATLQACTAGRMAPSTAAGIAAVDGAAPEQELGLLVAGALAQLDDPLDAVIVGGATTPQLRTAGGVPIAAVTGALTTTDMAHFSMVGEGVTTPSAVSVYLVPSGGYSLHAEAVTDTLVLVVRAVEDGAGFEMWRWEDGGTAPRALALSWDATTAGALEVDLGDNGSVDFEVTATVHSALAPPTGVTAAWDAAGDLVVRWGAVPDAASYTVAYGTESRYAPQFTAYDGALTATSTGAKIMAVPETGTYAYVAVAAVDGAGRTSLLSEEIVVAEQGRWTAVYLPLVVRGR